MITPPKTDHVPDEESFCEGLFSLQKTTFLLTYWGPETRDPYMYVRQ